MDTCGANRGCITGAVRQRRLYGLGSRDDRLGDTTLGVKLRRVPAARRSANLRTTISCVDDQHSDPRVRRRWLRVLDPVLTDEIRDAGALSCEDLMEMAKRPLDGRASRATIEEWWEYAHRRSWLEEHGTSRCQLSSIGRADMRELRQRISGPDPADWARTLMRWALPAGAIGAAVLLSDKNLAIGLAIVAVCVIVALMFFIAAPIARWADGPMDRWRPGSRATASTAAASGGGPGSIARSRERFGGCTSSMSRALPSPRRTL